MPEGTDDGGGGTAPAPNKDTTRKDFGNGPSGRNRRRPPYSNDRAAASGTMPRQPKFEGKCDGLRGHIYDCLDTRQSDQFTKTTKEIAEYVGRTYKDGGDVRIAVENLERPVFAEPSYRWKKLRNGSTFFLNGK